MPLQTFYSSRPVLALLVNDGDPAVSPAMVEHRTRQNPMAHIVVLSDRCTPKDALALLHAGADGYLPKNISCEALIKALELVMLGVTILPTGVGRLLGGGIAIKCDQQLEPASAPKTCDPVSTPRRLSDRETEILQCLSRGESNKHIARLFNITEATVKVHIKAILRKISVKNRTQAAVWAQHHFLDLAGLVNGVATDGDDHLRRAG